MHTKVQRIGIAAAMTTAALALAAGPVQAARSTITLSIGDQSSPANGYSWGASNSGSVGTPGGGAGAGKVNVGDLSVTKETDAMTPSLVRSVATGEHLQQVALQFTNGVFTSSYCLRDAMVSSVSNGASAGQDRPTDSVTFSFARFTFKVGTETFGFNIAENVPATNPC
jgi:type VI protein secretion system component Hcp